MTKVFIISNSNSSFFEKSLPLIILWGISTLSALFIQPASSLLVIRTLISISNSPFSERLINSWKFVPFPEASTPIFNFGENLLNSDISGEIIYLNDLSNVFLTN